VPPGRARARGRPSAGPPVTRRRSGPSRGARHPRPCHGTSLTLGSLARRPRPQDVPIAGLRDRAGDGRHGAAATSPETEAGGARRSSSRVVQTGKAAARPGPARTDIPSPNLRSGTWCSGFRGAAWARQAGVPARRGSGCRAFGDGHQVMELIPRSPTRSGPSASCFDGPGRRNPGAGPTKTWGPAPNPGHGTAETEGPRCHAAFPAPRLQRGFGRGPRGRC